MTRLAVARLVVTRFAPLLVLLALGVLGAAGPLRAAELKLATWNLEWLTLRPAGDPALPGNVRPKGPDALALLRRYAAALDADVVALQEVDGPEAAARVFPPERYTVVTTDDAVVQRVGFAIRRGIAFERNPDLAALDVNPPGAERRLRGGADVTLLLPGGRLRLLAVHLKTGCQEEKLSRSSRRNCETLRLQLPALQGWIRLRREEGVPFVLVGDFNRSMEGRDEVFAVLDAAAPLLRATEGQSTPCWGGNTFIDHILAGGAARGWMVPDSLRVLVYRETGPSARALLPDHCPVSVRFRLPD